MRKPADVKPPQTPSRAPSAGLLHPPGWRRAQAVFFDCDSTLSAVEGIDELGARAGIDVSELTRRSMSGELALDEVYLRRLEAVRPERADLDWLAERYWERAVAGAAEAVAALQAIGIECHVVSGGLLPAVLPFAQRLGFEAVRVHAVPYERDQPEASAEHPLARPGGKPELLRALCSGRLPVEARAFVGDGVSDAEAEGEVGLFIGFGGVADREAVRRVAPVFVAEADLAPVAVLAAGPAGWNDLAAAAPALAERGRAALGDPRRVRFRLPGASSDD